jgi:hypothetical protein
MSHETPLPAIHKDPPPPIPKDPVLDEGVLHIVTHNVPEGSGWSDVINVDSEKHSQQAISCWDRSPINISGDPNWRQKIRERGQKAMNPQT